MDKPEPLEIRDKARAAFAQLRVEVIERARRTGTPVVTWRNGRVCEVNPDDLDKESNKQSSNQQSKSVNSQKQDED